MPRLYCEVALPVPLRSAFTYTVPEGFAALPEAGSETDVGLKVTLGPEGDSVLVKLRIPENPFTLARVTVKLEEEP